MAAVFFFFFVGLSAALELVAFSSSSSVTALRFVEGFGFEEISTETSDLHFVVFEDV